MVDNPSNHHAHQPLSQVHFFGFPSSTPSLRHQKKKVASLLYHAPQNGDETCNAIETCKPLLPQEGGALVPLHLILQLHLQLTILSVVSSNFDEKVAQLDIQQSTPSPNHHNLH